MLLWKYPRNIYCVLLHIFKWSLPQLLHLKAKKTNFKKKASDDWTMVPSKVELLYKRDGSSSTFKKNHLKQLKLLKCQKDKYKKRHRDPRKLNIGIFTVQPFLKRRQLVQRRLLVERLLLFVMKNNRFTRLNETSSLSEQTHFKRSIQTSCL